MILAVDYGSKRIGLAIADEENSIPLPFKEILNKGIDLVIKDLDQIIKDEKITVLVVGLPINLGGTVSQKTQETKNFIDILAKNVSIPVVEIDERLSSKLADTLSLGTNGSRDVGAAMIILDDYLQRRKL